ncbi:hypothetical protein ACB098_09G166600 [Castanea mollissima]
MPSEDLAFPLYSALSTRNCCLLTYKKSLKMYHLWTSYFLMKLWREISSALCREELLKFMGKASGKTTLALHIIKVAQKLRAMFSINFVGANGSARLPFGVLSLEISHLSGN